jgi:hypothetical protein
MLTELSGKTRINEMTVREEFRKIKNRTFVSARKAVGPSMPEGNREEYLLLSAVIHCPEKMGYVLSRLDMKDIKDKTVVSLLEKISTSAYKDSPGKILDIAGEERTIFTRLSVEPGFDIEHADKNIEDCLMSIEKKKFEERLHLAELSGDLKLFNDLLLEKKKRLEGENI